MKTCHSLINGINDYNNYKFCQENENKEHKKIFNKKALSMVLSKVSCSKVNLSHFLTVCWQHSPMSAENQSAPLLGSSIL